MSICLNDIYLNRSIYVSLSPQAEKLRTQWAPAALTSPGPALRMPSARQLKVTESSFVVPRWCYARVNNWESRLKREMNPSDVILFIVSEDLCLTTHKAFPAWPVFTFCRCHFPLGYWCASPPRRPVLSMHFVKLTPRGHRGFCCTVCGGGAAYRS